MIPSDAAFHTAIFQALCSCLELSPSSPEASALIRRAYQEPESAPKPDRNENVIYYDVASDDSPDAGYMVFSGENPAAAGAYPAVSSFVPYRLVIVCYGPACVWNANRIRDFIFLDGAGYPRSILRKAGIYPVPRPAEPVLLHEEDGGLWRRRADLEIGLRVSDTQIRQNRRSGIAGPPVITIRRS